MSRVQNKSGSLRCACFSLALVNSNAFYKKLIECISGETLLRSRAIIRVCDNTVHSCVAAGIPVLTRSFNRAAGNKNIVVQGTLARARLQKALKVSRTSLKLGKTDMRVGKQFNSIALGGLVDCWARMHMPSWRGTTRAALSSHLGSLTLGQP